MSDDMEFEGYTFDGLRLTTVWSTHVPPRMLGDGCGCVRERDEWCGRMRWVLHPCERHAEELRDNPMAVLV